MTLSTSAVAVCCWSDSRSSLSSRVFSMAMTACAAKFVNQVDLLVSERADFLPINENSADHLALLKHRNGDNSAGASEIEEATARRIAVVSRFGFDIGNLNWLLQHRRARERRSSARANNRFEPPRLGVCRRRPMQCNGAECSRLPIGTICRILRCRSSPRFPAWR